MLSLLRRLAAHTSWWARTIGATALVCLCLVVGIASPSDAFSPSPGAIKIGETLAGGAAEVSSVGGTDAALCSTGLGCFAAIALTASATAPLWMPVVKGFLGKAFSADGAGAASCASTGHLSLSGAQATLQLTFSGCSGGGQAAGRVAASNSVMICESASGSVTQSAWGATFASSTPGAKPSATATAVLSGCASGSTLVYLSVQACVIGDTAWHAQYSVIDPASCSSPPMMVSAGTDVPAASLAVTGTAQCSLPDGTTKSVTVEVMSSTDPDNFPVPSCQAAYPGSVPTSLTLGSGFPGHEQPGITATFTNLRQAYPNCFDSNGAWLASCVVRVWVNGQACHVGTPGCISWQTDAQDNPGDTVECRLGAEYVLPLDSCNPLEHQYETGAGTKTITRIDQPGVGDDPDPGSDTNSDPSSDPAPQSGTDAPPSPAEGEDACASSSWSLLHPISTITHGVECAFQWAFEPASPLPEIAAPGLAAWLVPFHSLSSDCGAWSATLDMGQGKWHTQQPVSLPTTCSGIGGVVAGASRLLLPATLGAVAAVRIYRRGVRGIA